MLCLVVRKGKEKEHSFPLIQGVVAVGSHPNNDIQLDDSSSTISRFHFALFQNKNGNYHLQDLGSKNGTLVNGKITPHKILIPGDEVLIGKQFLLKFQDVKKARDDKKNPKPIRILSEKKNITELTRFASSVASKDVLSKLENSPEKLFLLYRMTKDLHDSAAMVDVMQGILERIIRATGAERGFIARGTTIDDLEYMARVPDEIITIRSRTLVTQALHEAEPFVVKDAQSDNHLKKIVSVSTVGIRSAIGIPLKGSSGIIGLLYLDSIRKPGIFTEEDVNFLSIISSDIALAITKDEEKDQLNRFAASEDAIVGISRDARKLLKSIEEIAPYPSSVLITGETGVGKELVAKAIHNLSNRTGRFVEFNCAAAPETLIESELFGYKKGSHSQAFRDKKGLFEIASGGTLFLDEIGNMTLDAQAKILKAIEEKEIRSLGATEPVTVDTRIIAATNKNLVEENKRGAFRSDLYQRLMVVEVHVPTLSKRKDDIPLLAGYFIYRLREKLNKDIGGLSRDAVELLMNYSWTGNIRELANVIESAAIYAKSSSIITPNLLKKRLSDSHESLKSLEDVEKEHIINVLEHTRGNKRKAASILGIEPQTLYNKLEKYKLSDFNFNN